MTAHHIGSTEDFPEGKGRKVSVKGIPIAVFNLGGEFHAIQNSCVHKNGPLHLAGSPRVNQEEQDVSRGEIDQENLTVRCPWHSLEWDLTSGHCDVLDRTIPTFDVYVEGDKVYCDF
jgi:nitrite reductase (NADH) small subunit